MKHKVLKYDLIEAHFAGVENHPQAEMKRLGLDGYYKAVPESIGDCWFFLFDTWPQVELPSYLSKIEIDDNKAPELKMKPGDKVWWFEPQAERIMEFILDAAPQEDVFGVVIDGHYPNVEDMRVIMRLPYHIFPTREALYEHYRKIFE